MGIVRTEISITNAEDTMKAKNGLISAKDVRSVTVNAIADTGALRLVIPESIRRQLGLGIMSKVRATLADGEKLECGVSEAVEVHWKDRMDISQAWVVPKDCSVLLGAIPMEGMDLMVEPKQERVVGVHGEEQLGILC